MAKSRFSKTEIFVILKKARDGASITNLCCDNRISGATFYQWRRKYERAENSSVPALDHQQTSASAPSDPVPTRAPDSATPTV